ncbi:MAG TPA: tRNA-specific adenosine deaminase, partial [Intrasporangium sp.]|nr:tRNA-specific adenosine deaminase [Intrasporangium sp.]
MKDRPETSSGARTTPPAYAAWLGEALALARAMAGSEDVPVGAVVIAPDGTLAGRGRNVREER